ncbi:hypothetical protein EIQ27_11180 [Xanthomonas campestris pv. armoraciae]
MAGDITKRAGALERESGIGNRESGIGNRESGIGNRESGIGNRESGIGNRVEAAGLCGVCKYTVALFSGYLLKRQATGQQRNLQRLLRRADPAAQTPGLPARCSWPRGG